MLQYKSWVYSRSTDSRLTGFWPAALAESAGICGLSLNTVGQNNQLAFCFPAILLHCCWRRAFSRQTSPLPGQQTNISNQIGRSVWFDLDPRRYSMIWFDMIWVDPKWFGYLDGPTFLPRCCNVTGRPWLLRLLGVVVIPTELTPCTPRRAEWL